MVHSFYGPTETRSFPSAPAASARNTRGSNGTTTKWGSPPAGMYSMTKLTIPAMAPVMPGIKAPRKTPNPTRLQNQPGKQNGLDEQGKYHIPIEGENDKKRLIIDVDAQEGNPSTSDNMPDKQPVPPIKRPKIDVEVPGKQRYVPLPITKESPLQQEATSRGLDPDPFTTGFKQSKDGGEIISGHFKGYNRPSSALPGSMRRPGLTQPNPSQNQDRGAKPPNFKLSFMQHGGFTMYENANLTIGRGLLFRSSVDGTEIMKFTLENVGQIQVSPRQFTLTQTDNESWCLLGKHGISSLEIDFRIPFIEIYGGFENGRSQGSL
jgi:hypothetical protein